MGFAQAPSISAVRVSFFTPYSFHTVSLKFEIPVDSHFDSGYTHSKGIAAMRAFTHKARLV